MTRATLLRAEYEVESTHLTMVGMQLGLKPHSEVRRYRWKWLAYVMAHLDEGVTPFGVIICRVRRARPKLRLIQGSLREMADKEQS